MQILIEQSELTNFVLDQFYALPYTCIVAQKKPFFKINFGSHPLTINFFNSFYYIDNAIIHSHLVADQSYITFPIKLGLDYRNENYDDLYREFVEDNVLDFNFFKLKETININEIKNKIMQLGANEDVICFVNFKPNFDLSYKHIVFFVDFLTDDIEKIGDNIYKISPLFLMLSMDLFKCYIGDPVLGRFLSVISSKKKIFIGESDDINSNIPYYKYARKILGIDNFDYSRILSPSKDEIERFL